MDVNELTPIKNDENWIGVDVDIKLIFGIVVFVVYLDFLPMFSKIKLFLPAVMGNDIMSGLLNNQILTFIRVQLTFDEFNVKIIESDATVAVSRYDIFLSNLT